MSCSNLRQKKCLLLSILFLCCLIYYIKLTQKRNEENLTEGIIIFFVYFIGYSFCIGHFWVFTDSHVDIFYQSHGDPAFYCHNISLNNISKIIRKFGQLNCHIPPELLYSAFSAAKRIDSNVDFIIWLGYIFIFNKFYPHTYTLEMLLVVTILIKFQPYLFMPMYQKNYKDFFRKH